MIDLKLVRSIAAAEQLCSITAILSHVERILERIMHTHKANWEPLSVRSEGIESINGRGGSQLGSIGNLVSDLMRSQRGKY